MMMQKSIRTKFCVLAAAVIFIAGCANKKYSVVPPVNTAYKVQINQSFQQLPNYTRIYFQNGHRVIQGNLDRWSTYCRLHVYNRDQQADYLTSVNKGLLRVSDVRNYRQSSNYVSGWDLIAANSTGFNAFKTAFGSNGQHFDPPSYYLYRVQLKLESADQPDVKTLICSKKWATRGDYYPTLAEIRTALGTIVELKKSDSY